MSRAGKGKAPGQRQLRVAENIREVLMEALQREEFYNSPLSRVYITVTEVDCSPDLRHARVFVTPLGQNVEGMEDVIEALNRQAGHFRKIISQKLHMKYLPQLSFRSDSAFDYASYVQEMLSSDKVRKDLDNSVSDT